MNKDRELLEKLAAHVAYTDHWLRTSDVFMGVISHLRWTRQRDDTWNQCSKVPNPYNDD